MMIVPEIEEIVDRVNRAIDAAAGGRILAPRIQELVNAADALRAAYEVMARSDGEWLWSLLAEFQSPDGTWLQIGKRDFERIVSSIRELPHD
jgi:hypothetical protein